MGNYNHKGREISHDFRGGFWEERDQRSEGTSSTLEFRVVVEDSRIRKKKFTFLHPEIFLAFYYYYDQGRWKSFFFFCFFEDATEKFGGKYISITGSESYSFCKSFGKLSM